MKRKFLLFSGWISLAANVLAITGFLLDRWPLIFPGPNHGLWVVLSFITTTYSLVIWSTWAWRRSGGRPSPDHAGQGARGGAFLLNAMAVLPALTVWLYLALGALELVPSLRWILALSIAWAGTPFIAMGLTWAGATLAPVLDRSAGARN